jgi:hypothetical protein
LIFNFKIPGIESKLIDGKLDYLSDKVDYTNELLEGLINITLDSPPDTIPEAPIKENKSEATVDVEASSVQSNSVRFCLYKYTYIWERNGRNYWAFLLNVDRRSVSGFRWTGRYWIYFGVDLRRIDSFVCYR